MRKTVRRYLLAPITLAVAALWQAPAPAQSPSQIPKLPVPTFATCNPATAPQLPLRWHAVGLMMPFLYGQLDIGEFTYDATLPAMRATVYGVESGAVDLLITDKDTYVLTGPHRSPTHCTSLGGKKLRPPSPQWLSSSAVCVGEAPLASEPVQWWQTPGAGTRATWHWFSTKTRLPWRSLFLNRALDPAIIGDYAMTYFRTFTPLPQTNLSALRDRCAATAKPNRTEIETDVPTARDLMVIPNKTAEAERKQRISELTPGIAQGACSRMAPLRWPDQFGTAVIITPIKFKEGPYSAVIYYDWKQTGTQLTYMYQGPQGQQPALLGFTSLKNKVGYRAKLGPPAGGVCQAVLPGIVRPDWMKAAWCECRGVIKGGAKLSPEADSEILSCPIKWQNQRIMWSWYTAQGRPIIFLEAAPEGGGVMLADYHEWLPGQTAQAGDFELPKACKTGHPGGSYSNVSCSDCHTTPF